MTPTLSEDSLPDGTPGNGRRTETCPANQGTLGNKSVSPPLTAVGGRKKEGGSGMIVDLLSITEIHGHAKRDPHTGEMHVPGERQMEPRS